MSKLNQDIDQATSNVPKYLWIVHGYKNKNIVFDHFLILFKLLKSVTLYNGFINISVFYTYLFSNS